jgi:Raf kinase inhibitor-like YbhB/YbcL family protein
MRLRLATALAAAFLFTSCGGDENTTTTPTTTTSLTESPSPTPVTFPGFTLSSPTFEDGGPMSDAYSCDGENRSPDLAWGDPPPGTQTFVLIMDDPDAPGGAFTHLLLYDLLPEMRSIPPDVDPTVDGPYPAGSIGLNDTGNPSYAGPCPPRGETHRYVFTLYAVDSRTGLEAAKTREEVMAAMEGHILAEATLTGTFGR